MPSKPTSKPTSTQTQITRVNGQRVRIVTRGGKVSVAAAPALEWELQAAAVRRLRTIPNILFAAGMESGKRGPKAQMQAVATGLAAGHPDMTILLPAGRVFFIEYKNSVGRLSPAQIARHDALRKLGHVIEVVKASTEEECADETERLVRRHMAANDNSSMCDTLTKL